VEEVFNIVKDLNDKEKVTFLLAEQNTNMALQYSDYGYIMESGRVVMDGVASDLRQQRRRQGVLPGRGRWRAQEFQGREELQATQALACMIPPACLLRVAVSTMRTCSHEPIFSIALEAALPDKPVRLH
jgi:ABC-type multidrug transport system ATPase subunit